MQSNNRVDNILVMDFETGGLDSKKNLALEFAGIWVESTDFREIDRYEALILPYSDDLTIEEKALESNGIKLEEIAELGIEVTDLVKNIISRTEKSNQGKMRGKKTIIVGQNAMFDIPFLQQIFKLTKQDLSKYFAGNKDYFGNFVPAYLDTQYMGRLKYAQDELKTTFNLSSLCAYEQVDLINAHRAMNDVEATLELFKRYILSLREGSATGETYSFRKNFTFQI
jgi:DNA polymerase III epsilon subunit-like protein